MHGATLSVRIFFEIFNVLREKLEVKPAAIRDTEESVSLLSSTFNSTSLFIKFTVYLLFEEIATDVDSLYVQFSWRQGLVSLYSD